jgi:sugar lactone lactonase YvrE
MGFSGRLYIADVKRNQILERFPNGKFQAVAGTGTAGFSGDGGMATRAKIDYPGGMAIGADGTLYFADVQNHRIRAIAPDGTISTIVGGGKGRPWVKNGASARAARLGPAAVAIGLGGRLYIASSGTNQVLRLEHNGTLTQVAGNQDYAGIRARDVGRLAVNESPAIPDGLAFDGAGNLYIAGFSAKVLLMITAKGVMVRLGAVHGFYPFGDGGMVTAPGGSVIAMNRASIVRLGPAGVKTVYAFYKHPVNGVVGTFEPNGIAVAPNGTIFADTYAGNGYTNSSALIAISPRRQIRVLWKS